MGCCTSSTAKDSKMAKSVEHHGSVNIEPSSAGFDPEQNFRVFMATWNVGDAEPASMAPLFAHINDCDGNMDLIVVAAQECNYKPKSAEEITVNEHWYKCIESLLPDYTLLVKKGMWTMRICVLVRKSIKEHVKDVVVSSEATGVGSVGGNKGGVAVGLTAFGTRLLFVGSHLAAHLEEVDKRNSDFYEIVQGIDGCYRYENIEPLNYFHHVFWCGDLNYRIDDLSAAEVIEHAQKGNIDALVPHDQLIREMKKGNVFHNFTEAAVPHFTPTYRFLRNTEGPTRDYDPWKARVPSWCDRILTKSLGSSVDKVKCIKYDAEHGVRSSDHSPVFAIYDVASRERMQARLDEASVSKNKYELTISNVSCTGLLNADSASLSDPYINFRVLDAGKQAAARTSTCKDTLAPDWGDKTFTLDLGEHNDIGLHYLHCVVMDEDVVKDDPLGQAVFPLEQFLGDDKLGTAVALKGPILHGGKNQGEIKLTVTIKIKA